ncbi:MAG: DUF1501 domain-containing protein [Bacteroidetes bacterium]|nr:DUF1501 domain-containing protein [Bacteroidota bacterium]
MLHRRDFLKLSSFASAAALVPNFLNIFNQFPIQSNGKKLVIIQKSGGCDGLNTYVPFENDLYFKARPQLGLSDSEIIKIGSQQGVNSAMKEIADIFNEGEMTILNQVGYPNPDRSHFRSMDIWHTGSNADEYWPTGWLGRYLDASCNQCAKPHHVLEIDDTLSLANKGLNSNALALLNTGQLYRATRDEYLQRLDQEYKKQKSSLNPSLDYMYKTMSETINSAAYIHEKAKTYRSKVNYPSGILGRQLKLVAELINSGVETSVYYTSLPGFDTHVRQKMQQERLLQQYSDAVAAFIQDLKMNNQFEDVLIMTFSEFGRRVEENASGGTDHGKANNLTLIGGKLAKPGFFNSVPNLTNLDEGDLKFDIDFRNVYASILRNWLEVDDVAILKREFEPLGLI